MSEDAMAAVGRLKTSNNISILWTLHINLWGKMCLLDLKTLTVHLKGTSTMLFPMIENYSSRKGRKKEPNGKPWRYDRHLTKCSTWTHKLRLTVSRTYVGLNLQTFSHRWGKYQWRATNDTAGLLQESKSLSLVKQALVSHPYFGG